MLRAVQGAENYGSPQLITCRPAKQHFLWPVQSSHRSQARCTRRRDFCWARSCASASSGLSPDGVLDSSTILLSSMPCSTPAQPDVEHRAVLPLCPAKSEPLLSLFDMPLVASGSQLFMQAGILVQRTQGFSCCPIAQQSVCTAAPAPEASVQNETPDTAKPFSSCGRSGCSANAVRIALSAPLVAPIMANPADEKVLLATVFHTGSVHLWTTVACSRSILKKIEAFAASTNANSNHNSTSTSPLGPKALSKDKFEEPQCPSTLWVSWSSHLHVRASIRRVANVWLDVVTALTTPRPPTRCVQR